MSNAGKKATAKFRPHNEFNLPPELEVTIIDDAGPFFKFRQGDGNTLQVPWRMVASVSVNAPIDTIEQTNEFMRSIAPDFKPIVHSMPSQESDEPFSTGDFLDELMPGIEMQLHKLRPMVDNTEKLSIDYIDVTGYRIQCFLAPTKGEDLKKGRYKLIFGSSQKGSKKKIVAIGIGSKPSECIDEAIRQVMQQLHRTESVSQGTAKKPSAKNPTQR